MAVFLTATIIIEHKAEAGGFVDEEDMKKQQAGEVESFKDFCNALVEVADHTVYDAHVEYEEVQG